jgi:hypothetical protein
VLAVVPDVLDPDKDSGAEEADPYVLALAFKLRTDGIDARIVTEESRDSPRNMSISTAAGILGIPSVPLRAVLGLETLLKRSENRGSVKPGRQEWDSKESEEGHRFSH